MQQKTIHRLLCLGLILAVIPNFALAALRVTFFSEKIGTSALVQADGQAMLIVAEPEISTDEIMSSLDDIGVQKIDLLAGTLLQEDHIGALGAILNKYQTGSLWLPGTAAEDLVFQSLQSAIQASDTMLNITMPGDRYDLGDAKITVLEFPNRSDGNALIPGHMLRIDYGKFSFLFTSGSGAVSEGGLMSSEKIFDVDVLVIGKYDSESHYQLLLDTVSPSWVISDGDGEITQEETRTILMDQGIHWLQPTRDKTIIFNSDGVSLQADHVDSGIVFKSSVNLRKDASIKSGKVASLAKGTLVAILGTKVGPEGIWFAIEANGKTGFVRGDLIEEISLEEAERLLAEATLNPRISNSNRQTDNDVLETQEDSPAECH